MEYFEKNLEYRKWKPTKNQRKRKVKTKNRKDYNGVSKRKNGKYQNGRKRKTIISILRICKEAMDQEISTRRLEVNPNTFNILKG